LISEYTPTFEEALEYARRSEESEGIFALTVGPTENGTHATPEDGACTISSCCQGEDAKKRGAARPTEEYGSALKSEEGRGRSTAFIKGVIELLKKRREPNSAQSPLEDRLSTIATHYEPPGHTVPSKDWLDDEDIEDIHQALGTPVVIWDTDQSGRRGRLIRPQTLMSAAEAADFMATAKTWIEASPSHYTCFGHSIGGLLEIPDHASGGGLVYEETLRQAASLLVRASKQKEQIKERIDAQRCNPREARLAARKAGAAEAGAQTGSRRSSRSGQARSGQERPQKTGSAGKEAGGTSKTRGGADQGRTHQRPHTGGRCNGDIEPRGATRRGGRRTGALDTSKLPSKGRGRGGATIRAASPQRGGRPEGTKTRGQHTRRGLRSTESGIGVENSGRCL
jgi:hypothetical protein